ncbi:MAG: hypothetical protein CM15mV41_0670 [Caudoviricetes sp.]|nr:MAG: hypothetical protein CM15mV41_0670 [Caudoviricetes sp.]
MSSTLLKLVVIRSHKVSNLNSSVILVSISSKGTATLCKTLCEGVRNHSVTSLEPNLGAEGVRINRTNLLKRNVRAIEQTCVIRGSTLVTSNIEVLICNVSRIRINVDLDLTVECTYGVEEVSSTPVRALLPLRAGE